MINYGIDNDRIWAEKVHKSLQDKVCYVCLKPVSDLISYHPDCVGEKKMKIQENVPVDGYEPWISEHIIDTSGRR